LIPGYPLRRLTSTHGADAANPPPGIFLFPSPSVTDTAFTLTKRTSVAQPRFYTPGPSDPDGNGYPAPHSGARIRGTRSDYLSAVLHPAVQAGGAKVLLELQGAQALDPLSDRTRVDPSRAFTDWTTDVDDLDGFPYVRWRATLVSNLNSNVTARVDAVWLPVVSLP
jgi:hypothetical protein